MTQHWNKLDEQLQGTVSVVRKDISNLQRATLEALIVLDVHAKDVIKDELIDKGVASAADFAWLSQLRYYWEEKDTLRVKMVTAIIPYAYEYLGNSPRLVITDLTDKCYRTPLVPSISTMVALPRALRVLARPNP